MKVNESLLYKLIGERLRACRVKLDLSQAELAERVGMLRTSISNIEAGRQKLPLHVLYLICHLLETDVESVIPSMEEVLIPDLVSIKIDGEVKQVPPRTAAVLKRLLEE
jgi:transcriptional regulator with XRE-family HTH domain